MFTAFYFIFYSYLWDGKLNWIFSLNSVQIELVSFLLIYFCWLIRVSLFIDLGFPYNLGKGWWGHLGPFVISRPI